MCQVGENVGELTVVFLKVTKISKDEAGKALKRKKAVCPGNVAVEV